MVLNFRGTAHPPPSKTRGHEADLSAAEIGTANIGGRPLLVEHDHSDQVGHVTSSWEGTKGELRVSGVVYDAEAEKLLRTGQMRGLSLGTSVFQDEKGARLFATHDELSICKEPRRGGCYVDAIDGKSVTRGAQFSKRAAGAPARPARPFSRASLRRHAP